MFKIAHLGDTHIRNLKYHQEYRIVFKELYKQLRKKNPDYIEGSWKTEGAINEEDYDLDYVPFSGNEGIY